MAASWAHGPCPAGPLASGAEICRLDHDGPVNAVVFSPDGTRVATVSDGGSVRVWYADHSQLVEQAMGRLTRNLTRQEWSSYFRGEPYRETQAGLPSSRLIQEHRRSGLLRPVRVQTRWPGGISAGHAMVRVSHGKEKVYGSIP
ncbi:MAG TPA: WD40 repeat domain-containing protein [Trebonia sp.]